MARPKVPKFYRDLLFDISFERQLAATGTFCRIPLRDSVLHCTTAGNPGERNSLLSKIKRLADYHAMHLQLL
jgi:hypothetical protein